jgi:probable addiction module antidote protein
MPMEKIKIKDFNISEHLKTDEDMMDFLQASLEESDPNIFISALNAVVRLKGVAGLAEEAGVGRESLYKSLAPGAKPRFETIAKITKALGFPLGIQPPEKISSILTGGICISPLCDIVSGAADSAGAREAIWHEIFRNCGRK